MAKKGDRVQVVSIEGCQDPAEFDSPDFPFMATVLSGRDPSYFPSFAIRVSDDDGNEWYLGKSDIVPVSSSLKTLAQAEADEVQERADHHARYSAAVPTPERIAAAEARAEEMARRNAEPLFPDLNPKTRIGAAKPSIGLIPPAALIHFAKAMENGASKYGAYNWRDKQVEAMTYVHASLRHILAYLDGEDIAEDSGVHHLAHAGACMALLLDALETGNLVDNRPTAGAAARLIKEHTDAVHHA